MELFKAHILSAGPVIYPLLACSVLMLAIIVERFIVTLLYPPVNAEKSKAQFERGEIHAMDKKHGLNVGLQLLNQNRNQPKALRDEVLAVWLQAQRRKLHAHLRWLMLLGGVAPLLGLLGTVLGIISMFQNVAHVTGPVTPALLADGMWEAMVTTALGMMIAIPALIAGQLFSIWGDHRVAVVEQVLNECSLSLPMEPVDFSDTDPGRKKIIKPAAFQSAAEGQLA